MVLCSSGFIVAMIPQRTASAVGLRFAARKKPLAMPRGLCNNVQRCFSRGRRRPRPHSLEVRTPALSRLRHGFDSRWGHHLNFVRTRGGASLRGFVLFRRRDRTAFATSGAITRSGHGRAHAPGASSRALPRARLRYNGHHAVSIAHIRQRGRRARCRVLDAGRVLGGGRGADAARPAHRPTAALRVRRALSEDPSAFGSRVETPASWVADRWELFGRRPPPRERSRARAARSPRARRGRADAVARPGSTPGVIDPRLQARARGPAAHRGGGRRRGEAPRARRGRSGPCRCACAATPDCSRSAALPRRRKRPGSCPRFCRPARSSLLGFDELPLHLEALVSRPLPSVPP